MSTGTGAAPPTVAPGAGARPRRSEPPPAGALVVGLGNPGRGDDAVGPAVAARVARALAGRGGAGDGALVDGAAGHGAAVDGAAGRAGRGGVPGPLAVDVVELEDPTLLVDLLRGRELAVVVDAVRVGAAPGTLHVLETGAAEVPLPDRTWRRSGRGGTHGFGLAAAVELARALRQLPARLVVLGVEAESFGHGDPLSPAVAAAVGAAAERAVGCLLAAPAPGDVTTA